MSQPETLILMYLQKMSADMERLNAEVRRLSSRLDAMEPSALHQPPPAAAPRPSQGSLRRA